MSQRFKKKKRLHAKVKVIEFGKVQESCQTEDSKSRCHLQSWSVMPLEFMAQSPDLISNNRNAKERKWLFYCQGNFLFLYVLLKLGSIGGSHVS